MALPTAPMAQDIDLRRSRILVHSRQGAGKSHLFAGWFPQSTLVIDFDDAWRMFPGEYFRVTPKTFAEVYQLVIELTTKQHQFTTVIVDTITRAWRLADLEAGSRYGKNAAGVVEYGKGTADRDGTLMRAISPLLTSQMGVVLLAHSKQESLEGDRKMWIPAIDPRVYDDIVGGVDFCFFLEKESRRLLTQPTPTAEVKTRFQSMASHIDVPTGSPRDAALALHGAITDAAKVQSAPTAAAAEAKGGEA